MLKGKFLGKFRVAKSGGGTQFMYRYGLSGDEATLAKVREHMEEVGIDPTNRIDEETGLLTYNFFNRASASDNHTANIQLTRAGRPFIEDETAEVIDQVSKIEDPTVRGAVANLVAQDIYAKLTGKSASAPVAQPTQQVAPSDANLSED